MGHERDLLGFCKKVFRHSVKHQTANRLRGEYFFWNYFGGIENVEIEAVREFLVKYLQTEVPLRKIP